MNKYHEVELSLSIKRRVKLKEPMTEDQVEQLAISSATTAIREHIGAGGGLVSCLVKGIPISRLLNISPDRKVWMVETADLNGLKEWRPVETDCQTAAEDFFREAGLTVLGSRPAIREDLLPLEGWAVTAPHRVRREKSSSDDHHVWLDNSFRFPSGHTVRAVPDSVAGPEYEAIDPVEAAPLVPAWPGFQLSEHFHMHHFRPEPQTYKYARVSPRLLRVLDAIVERAGEPLLVTSGYRPPAYNREVGGVSNSTHIDGLAADIYTKNLSLESLHEICVEVIGDGGGVGYYPKSGFIHVDVRGYRARWSGQ